MDGESVSIWEDCCIPRVENKNIGYLGLVDSQLPEKMADIIDRNNEERKLNSIKNWFSGEEYQLKKFQSVNMGDMIDWFGLSQKMGIILLSQGTTRLKRVKI